MVGGWRGVVDALKMNVVVHWYVGVIMCPLKCIVDDEAYGTTMFFMVIVAFIRWAKRLPVVDSCLGVFALTDFFEDRFLNVKKGSGICRIGVCLVTGICGWWSCGWRF